MSFVSRRVCAVIAVVGIVAGCTGGGASTSPSDPGPSSTTVPGTQPAPSSDFEAVLYDAAKQEGKVVWWDQHEVEIAQKYIDAFEAQYPGVTVEYVLTTQESLQRAVAENRANRLTMDITEPDVDFSVFEAEGMVSDNTDVLKAAGLPDNAIVNGMFQDEWETVGAAYNPEMLQPDELPRTWDDLLDPKWKGKLGIDNRLRPYIWAIPHWGRAKVEEYLLALKEQDGQYRPGETANTTLMLAGEFPLFVGAFVATKIEMEGKPWAFVPMDEVFTIQRESGFTIPPKAPHPNAAKLFLYWYAGPEGRRLVDEIRFRGDPRPGTGSGPSRFLEELGTEVRVSPEEYNANLREYQTEFLKLLGQPID